MQRSGQYLRRLYYGFDEHNCYLRIDVDPSHFSRLDYCLSEFTLAFHVKIQVIHHQETLSAQVVHPRVASIPCAFQKCLEMAIPLELLELTDGQKLPLRISLRQQDGHVLEQHPTEGAFDLVAPSTAGELHGWNA